MRTFSDDLQVAYLQRIGWGRSYYPDISLSEKAGGVTTAPRFFEACTKESYTDSENVRLEAMRCGDVRWVWFGRSH